MRVERGERSFDLPCFEHKKNNLGINKFVLKVGVQLRLFEHLIKPKNVDMD